MDNGIRQFTDQGDLDITGMSFIPLGRFVHHMNLNGLLYDPNLADSSLTSGHIFMIMNDYLNGKTQIDPDYVIIYMNNVCEATHTIIPSVGKLFVNGRFFGLIGQAVPPMQELYTCGKLGRRSGFYINPKLQDKQSDIGGERQIEEVKFPDPFTIGFSGR